mgnify:CR=1 FL=1
MTHEDSRFNYIAAKYSNGTDMEGNAMPNCTIIATRPDGNFSYFPADNNNPNYAYIKARHDDADDSFTIADAD